MTLLHYVRQGSLGVNFTATVDYVDPDDLRKELEKARAMLNNSGFNETYLTEAFDTGIDEGENFKQKLYIPYILSFP